MFICEMERSGIEARRKSVKRNPRSESGLRIGADTGYANDTSLDRDTKHIESEDKKSSLCKQSYNEQNIIGVLYLE